MWVRPRANAALQRAMHWPSSCWGDHRGAAGSQQAARRRGGGGGRPGGITRGCCGRRAARNQTPPRLHAVACGALPLRCRPHACVSCSLLYSTQLSGGGSVCTGTTRRMRRRVLTRLRPAEYVGAGHRHNVGVEDALVGRNECKVDNVCRDPQPARGGMQRGHASDARTPRQAAHTCSLPAGWAGTCRSTPARTLCAPWGGRVTKGRAGAGAPCCSRARPRARAPCPQFGGDLVSVEDERAHRRKDELVNGQLAGNGG